jgi:transcriptional regulator with XRE-family HTH domain/O-antigen ligase
MSENQDTRPGAAGEALAQARRGAGLTEKQLADQLGLSLWEVDQLERGETDPTPYLNRITDLTGTAPAELVPPSRSNGESRALQELELPAAPVEQKAARNQLDRGGYLVLGSIAALVLVRFFTEVTGILPRALNFVDVPIVIALGVAAILSRKARPPRGQFSRALLPLSIAMLVLIATSAFLNPSRVEIGPALVFAYCILSPLLVYRSALQLWPTGCARQASRFLVALGIIELIVAIVVDVPRFIASDNPDVVSGTFGTNAYQFVFFMLLFVTLVTGIYSFERGSLTARFGPALVSAGLAFIVLAQYRALLLTIGLSLLLVAALVSGRHARRRGLIGVGVALLALMAALAFGAQHVPILKVHQTLDQDPRAIAHKRLNIADQVSKLYGENPRFVLTGSGPGTYSSRGWQTFALSNSSSQSNVQGKYVRALTGGKPYHTDVSDKYVLPILQATGESSVVAGSRAANSPYADYTSIAAEIGILGLLVLLAIYVSAFLTALQRTRRAIASVGPRDSVPGLLLMATIGFFALIQMAALDNWLEVARVTFLVWIVYAIATKEFDSRRADQSH